ncbi:MAG: sodium:solute symporter family protein [Planctomycetota bacterium]
MDGWIITTSMIGVFLLVSLGLGFLARARSDEGAEDFLICGRKTRFWLLYFTVVASFHSAFVLLGAPAAFYKHGVSFWVAGVWTMLVGALGIVLGPRIWALGKRFGHITPADLLGHFYGGSAVRLMVAGISILFTMTYIQAQAQGLGYILTEATQGKIPEAVATGILIAVAGLYLTIGGLRAIYFTDALQGIWMYIALWVAAIWIVADEKVGGVTGLFSHLAEERPEWLTLPGPQGFFGNANWFAFGWIFSLGILLQPHLFMRYYSAIDAKTVRWLGATTPIYLTTLFIPAALVGLSGLILLPDLQGSDIDLVLPRLLTGHVSPWLAGLILAGAAAAAMSTVDSIIHANMTIFTRDLYQRFVKPDASDRQLVFVGRFLAWGLLLIAYLLTTIRPDFLVRLVGLSGAGAMQLAPCVAGALFPKWIRFTSKGACAGLVVGLIVLIDGTISPTHQVLGLHPAILAVLVNLVVTSLVSRVTKPHSEEQREAVRDCLSKMS